MSNDRVQAIIEGAEFFGKEIISREQNLQKPIVADLFPTLISVLKGSHFNGRWNKTINQEFYQSLGTFDDDGKLIKTTQELFRVGVGLSHILQHLKKTLDLQVSHWPTVNLYPRQHLALTKNKHDIMHLTEYHTLVRILLSKGANFNATSLNICGRLVLSMIALDGIMIGLADRKIAFLRSENVRLGDAAFVAIATGRSQATYKQYFIGKYSVDCLKILLNRVRKNGLFFPESWAQKKGHRKTERRKFLENLLSDLWGESFPDRNVPEWLDVNFWISASRQSMEMFGVPYLCIATLSNKVRGAQLPMSINGATQRQTSDFTANACEEEHEYLLLRQFTKVISSWDKKTTLGKIKRLLAIKLKVILEDWLSGCHINQNEQKICEWLIWMVEKKDFSKMTLSTFEGYISTLKRRVMPFLQKKEFLSLDQSGWEKLVEEAAQNQGYMPSSRRQALTHIARFHTFLCTQYNHIPKIDFNNARYRVFREYADCDVIFPHEVDQVLDQFAPGTGVWLAILFGFYCGLRCEEVSYLSVRDLDDEYRLVIGRSKLKTSRRTLPYNLLIPPNYMIQLRKVLVARESSSEKWLICDAVSLPVSPDTLSKRVGRALKSHDCRVQKMHALRHGFASWQLVRYFMLVDKQFREDVRSGFFHAEIDVTHPWFSKEMLTWYAELLGGVRWSQDFAVSHCHATSIDMILISKLLGHVNRFTTIENYTNSLGWISRYYLNRRSRLILS